MHAVSAKTNKPELPARKAQHKKDLNESTDIAARCSPIHQTYPPAACDEALRYDTTFLSVFEHLWRSTPSVDAAWTSTSGTDIPPWPSLDNENLTLKYSEEKVNNDMAPSNWAPCGYELLDPRSCLDNVPAWKRRLLLHCKSMVMSRPLQIHFNANLVVLHTHIDSESIATEMIAIDGPHNGWRYLVLPIAETDELVMDAVLAVSSFHRPLLFRAWCSGRNHEPASFYTRAIQGLRQRSQLQNSDRDERHAVILTILLLLTAIMVTGLTDFPVLFGMLQSAVDAIGGVSELGFGDVPEFLARQIGKYVFLFPILFSYFFPLKLGRRYKRQRLIQTSRMRVYAAPLLSEDSGIQIISSEAETKHMFDCLNYCLQRSPEHPEVVEIIPCLVRQACEIYLSHARYEVLGPTLFDTIAMRVSDSIDRVQRFQDTLEAFPRGAPGEQVLIWACFIAASDCILEEHKAFFENFFMRQFARSGFRNLEMGLDALRKIWSRSLTERWTTMIPQTMLFIM